MLVDMAEWLDPQSHEPIATRCRVTGLVFTKSLRKHFLCVFSPFVMFVLFYLHKTEQLFC